MLLSPAAGIARPKRPDPEIVARIQARGTPEQTLVPWTDFEERTYLRGEPIVVCAGFGDETGQNLMQAPAEGAYLVVRLLGSGPTQTIPLRNDGKQADLRADDGISCAALLGLSRPGRYRMVLRPRHAPGYESRALEFNVSKQSWLEVHHPAEAEKVPNDRPPMLEVLLRGPTVEREQITLTSTFVGPSGRETEIPLREGSFPGFYTAQLDSPLVPGPWRIRFAARGKRGSGGRYETLHMHRFEVVQVEPVAAQPTKEPEITDPAIPSIAQSWLLVFLAGLGLGLGATALTISLINRRQSLQGMLIEAAEAGTATAAAAAPMRAGPLQQPATADGIPTLIPARQQEEIVQEVLARVRASMGAGAAPATLGVGAAVAASPAVAGDDALQEQLLPEEEFGDALLFDDLLAGAEDGDGGQEMLGLDDADIDALMADLAAEEGSDGLGDLGALGDLGDLDPLGSQAAGDGALSDDEFAMLDAAVDSAESGSPGAPPAF